MTADTSRPEELAALRAALDRLSPLPESAFARLPLTRQVLPRGAVLLRAGEAATRTGFVLAGALREYWILEDGSERTRSFNLPGDFAGSLSDLLEARPSRIWVTAERDSVVLAADWATLRQLSDTDPAWGRLSRAVAEQLYLRKVEREYELLALDAAARYRRTLERWPTLEQLFSQRDIASYIGITPVHLSRLRGRKSGG